MESLLRCIFSNPKATFNFIKKRLKSDLAADQLLVCVNFLLCVLSSLLGLVSCLSSSALGLGETLLTRPQLQDSGRSGLKWLGSLLQRPQSGVDESSPGTQTKVQSDRPMPNRKMPHPLKAWTSCAPQQELCSSQGFSLHLPRPPAVSQPPRNQMGRNTCAQARPSTSRNWPGGISVE